MASPIELTVGYSIIRKVGLPTTSAPASRLVFLIFKLTVTKAIECLSPEKTGVHLRLVRRY